MRSTVQRKSNQDALRKALDTLTKRQVLVGIPAGAGEQTGSQLPIAAVGYIQETGSPAANIPARPWLAPGIASVQDKITAAMKKGAEEALAKFDRPSDCAAAVERAHTAAGLAAVVGVKTYIDNTIAPPLSPRTLYARRHRKDRPNSRDRPLRDRDDLYKAITFVIRDRNDG